MKPLPTPPVEPGWYSVRSRASPLRFPAFYTDEDVRLGGCWNTIHEFIGPFGSKDEVKTYIARNPS